MHLKQLSILNFKNYEAADLSFSNKMNCFLGNNGVGKTNILDAIYYLSFCKSYFNPVDSQNIRHDEAFFAVSGVYLANDKEMILHCGLKRNQKKQFKKNKKAYDRLADHIGVVPLVIISPSDVLLIIEGSDIRRKFMDGIIAQYDATYLTNLLAYNKALNQRNLLLRSFWLNNKFDSESLELWDQQLAQYGNEVHVRRKDFVDGFIPIFQRYYTLLSGDGEQVDLEYKSALNEDEFADLLLKGLEKDRANHYTNVGIHKDDLVFRIGKYPLKKFGSQGQQKTYLLALKLAQADLIKNISGKNPIVLLDDIYDKLDSERMIRLLRTVGDDAHGQVFITDTDQQRIPELLAKEGVDFKAFKIKEGVVADV